MKCGALISNGREQPNLDFLNELEEGWHDEPFSPDLDQVDELDVRLRASAAGIGCSYEALARDYAQTNYSSSSVGADSEGLAQLEPGPGRAVEVALPLIEPVAA